MKPEPLACADRNAYILFSIHGWPVDELTKQFLEELKAMYAGYARRQGWKVETLATATAALRILGWRAYGVLSGEEGVHRAQRFQSNKKRRIHTAFVEVTVVPEAIKMEWEPIAKDVHEVVFYSFNPNCSVRASVRFDYVAKGLTVFCCEDTPASNLSVGRYILQRNRTAAWSLLLHRLRIMEQSETPDAALSDVNSLSQN